MCLPLDVQAPSSHKRVAPVTHSEDTVRMTKQAKAAMQAVRQRIKAGDYQGIIRRILKHAQVIYRCAISTIDAFPSSDVEMDFACGAWGDACHMNRTEVEPDEDLLKLVSFGVA